MPVLAGVAAVATTAAVTFAFVAMHPGGPHRAGGTSMQVQQRARSSRFRLGQSASGAAGDPDRRRVASSSIPPTASNPPAIRNVGAPPAPV
jgi:hypothetical protein